MATILLEDERLRRAAALRQPGLGLGAPRAPGAEVIGRRPPINMGMADVVQPQGLPRPAGLPVTLPTAATPAALPAPAAAAQPVASTLGRVARVAGPVVGGLMEGKQVYDVATNPAATGIDVAAQVAQGAGRLGAAGAGAAGGAALGSVAGPPGAFVGGLIGGAAGYLGADQAISAGRNAVGGGALVPPTAAAPVESGGAVFGIYPRPNSQYSTNLNDAALQRGVVATGPSTFTPAQPVVAPAGVAPAAPQRLDATTDPRSTLYAGGLPPQAAATAPAAPAAPAGGIGATAAPGDGLGLVSATGVTSSDRLGQMQRDIAFQQDKQTWRSPNDPTPGLAVIDNGGANRNQEFNAQAELRSALARTTTTRRGTVVDPAAEQIATGIRDRSEARLGLAREANATQRSLIAERGAQARNQLADTRQQQANSIAERRLDIEAAKIGESGTPSGYRRTASGGLEFIPGGPADPTTKAGGGKPLTEGQSKALLFGTRMQASEKVLDDLEKAGKLFSTPGAGAGYGIGAAVNLVNSKEGQQLDQAKRDFLNAVLRRESGAVIADNEFASGNQQYFPQAGDSKEVIAQKKANRQLATRGILAEVPDSENRVAQVRGPDTAAPAAAPAVTAATERPPGGWGKRADGSEKGDGFFGAVRRPDGNVSTEISVGVNIDGKEVEIPTLVPTLTAAERQELLALPEGRQPSQAIVQKAADFARQRMASGKSPFAGPSERIARVGTLNGRRVVEYSNGQVEYAN